MNIYFGNVLIEELERRTGWKISEKDKIWLNSHREDNNEKLNSENFHIYDKPLCITTGSSISKQLVDILTAYELQHPSDEPFDIRMRD